MTWSDVRGHDAQVAMLRRAIQRNRLAHAYLFVGSGGIGKRRFALEFAQCLMCSEIDDSELDACGECPACRMCAAKSHPDVITVGRLSGKSELTVDVFIGAKEQRGRAGLCYELTLRPMAGGRRIAIIDDADLMNEESANALLKTLEEPPENSLLILLSENPDGLLPTIRSRCQVVRFSPLSRNDITELLLQTEAVETPAEAEAIAEMSGGSMVTAAQLRDPQLRQLRESLYGHLASDDLRPLDAAVDTLQTLDELGGSSIEKRQNALWAVQFCVEFYRLTLRLLTADRSQDAGHSTGAETPLHYPSTVQHFANRFSPNSADDLDRVMALIDRAASTEQQLDRNASLPLCLETLFDDLARIQRRT